MTNPSFFQKNAKAITAGTGVVGAIAAVVSIFVSNHNATSTEIGDVTGSNGVVAVGPNATVGQVNTNVYGKTEKEESAEKLRAARANCEAEHRKMAALPITDYLMRGILLPAGAMVDRVAYEKVHGAGAMDALVKYYDSQVSVVWDAVMTRGATRSANLKDHATGVIMNTLVDRGASDETIARTIAAMRRDESKSSQRADLTADIRSMDREQLRRLKPDATEVMTRLNKELAANPGMSSAEQTALMDQIVMQSLQDEANDMAGRSSETEQERTARRSSETWAKRNPLIRKKQIYQQNFGADYRYEFRTDHPTDDPMTEVDEIGEFYRVEFLNTYMNFCRRI